MSREEQITISANNLSHTMKKLLKEYGNKANEVCRDVVKEVAQETSKQLKATSPVKTGNYAKGWGFKPMKVSGMLTEYVVYNKKAPGLTHLLEHGHGGRSPASAKPHIKPAEDFSIAELERRIREELEQ